MNEELLTAILAENKKRTLYSRLVAIFTGVIAVAVLVSAFLVIPKINELSQKNKDMIVKATEVMEKINVIADNANKLVEQNAENMTDAMEKIKNIDYDSLNKAIQELSDTIEPFSKVVNFFK